MNKGGFSWKRLTGVTKFKQQISRATGVPMTKSGRQRKIGGAVGGCYIATAVYGSYDSPEVKILRKYRDDVLFSTFQGRVFIKTYYFLSPKILKLFGKSKWFNAFFKKKLDEKIIKIQNRQGNCL